MAEVEAVAIEEPPGVEQGPRVQWEEAARSRSAPAGARKRGPPGGRADSSHWSGTPHANAASFACALIVDGEPHQSK